MKKLTTLLSFLILFTAFTCENEPLDQDLIGGDTNDPNNPSSGSLVGEWALVSFNVDISTSYNIAGQQVETDILAESTVVDYTLIFNEATYTTSGDYAYDTQLSISGLDTQNGSYEVTDSTGSGTYSTSGNEMTVNGQFFEFTFDGVDETIYEEDAQTVEFSFSNDGNTLTFTQDDTQVDNSAGFEVTIINNSTSVWQRVGDVQPSNCDEATTAADEAETAYNADTTNTDLCSAYITALQNQIAACGDTDGSIQAIIDGLDCSSSESLFLHQRIISYQDGSTYTETFTYDGNNLTSISDSDGYEYTYEYENDLLTRINYYDDSNNLVDYTITEYDSQNRLSSYTVYITLDNEGLRFDLTYNTDGTITEKEYHGDHDSQTSLISEEIISMDNDQILNVSSSDGSIIISYAFDNKNGIYKNISNLKTINLLDIDFSGYIEGGMNNVLTVSDDQSVFEEYEYTYNANNYPETSTDYWEGQLESTTQYTYY